MLVDGNLHREDVGRWEPNTSFGAGHDPGKSEEKWKELLSPDVIGVVEFLCRNEMAELGYTCTQSECEQLSCLRAYQENESCLLPWTRIPGLLLDDGEKNRQIERDTRIRS